MIIDRRAVELQEQYYNDRYNAGYMDSWPVEKQQRIAELVLSLSLPAGARVLEFGCGTGVFAQAIKKAAPHLDVHGFDISSAAIEKGRRRYPDIRLFDELPINKAAYDLVLTHHVLEHVADLSSTLGLIAGLVKHSGQVLHVLPCGNEGSLERRLIRLIRHGIDEAQGGRHINEDPSHLRRLNANQLQAGSEPFGLRTEHAFFANQFWGGLEYLTNQTDRTLREWYSPALGVDQLASLKLASVQLGLRTCALLRQVPPHVIRTVGRPRPAKKRLAFAAAFLPSALLFPLSKILDRALRSAADREWRFNRCSQDGSEMYISFRKDMFG